MTDTLVLLNPPDALPDARSVEPVPLAGRVALLVDDTVAAIAAASWAARLACEKRTCLLVVVLVPFTETQEEDAAALLARVQPALDRAGRPYTVEVCSRASAASAERRARRTAQRVGELLGADVRVLVCPGAATSPGPDLALRVAAARAVDLLIVPDLRSLPDARAVGVPAETDNSRSAAQDLR